MKSSKQERETFYVKQKHIKNRFPHVQSTRQKYDKFGNDPAFISSRLGYQINRVFLSHFSFAGNHHDLYQIEKSLGELFSTLSSDKIPIDEFFANADANFDSKEFRGFYFRNDIIAKCGFQ